MSSTPAVRQSVRKSPHLPIDHRVDRLLTVPQVAEIIAMDKRTVYRMIDAGTLPRPIKLGSASRFSSSEIAAYVERLKQQRGAQ